MSKIESRLAQVSSALGAGEEIQVTTKEQQASAKARATSAPLADSLVSGASLPSSPLVDAQQRTKDRRATATNLAFDFWKLSPESRVAIIQNNALPAELVDAISRNETVGFIRSSLFAIVRHPNLSPARREAIFGGPTREQSADETYRLFSSGELDIDWKSEGGQAAASRVLAETSPSLRTAITMFSSRGFPVDRLTEAQLRAILKDASSADVFSGNSSLSAPAIFGLIGRNTSLSRGQFKYLVELAKGGTLSDACRTALFDGLAANLAVPGDLLGQLAMFGGQIVAGGLERSSVNRQFVQEAVRQLAAEDKLDAKQKIAMAVDAFFAESPFVQLAILKNDRLPAEFVKLISEKLNNTAEGGLGEAIVSHPMLSQEAFDSFVARNSRLRSVAFAERETSNLAGFVLNRIQLPWTRELAPRIDDMLRLAANDESLKLALLRQRSFPVARFGVDGLRQLIGGNISLTVLENQGYTEAQFDLLFELAQSPSRGSWERALLKNPGLPQGIRDRLLASRSDLREAVSLADQRSDQLIGQYEQLATESKAQSVVSIRMPEVSSPAIAPVEAGRDVARGNPGVARLKQGAVGVAYELIMSDPELSQRAKRLLNGKAELLQVDGLSASALREIGRPGWLALFANPATRSLAVKAINDEATRISNDVKTVLDTLPPGARFYVPTVVVGTGPQAASFMNELARTNPNARLLAVDAEERLAGGNFDSLGKMFNLNSREGEDTGDRPLPGTDETLNKVISQVTPSDLGGQRWNPANSVAISAAVGAYASGAEFLLGETLLDVTDGKTSGVGAAQQWPGRYKMVFESGRELYTDDVVIGAGLGTERLPFADAASIALAEEERAKVDLARPDQVPQVVTTGDAFRLAQKSVSPRDAYRGKDNVTLVVGAGDSARTFIELLQGLGPQSAYTGEGKDDTAQRGGVGPTVWLTGKDGFSGCDEYLAQSRPRYAQLSVALKAPDENSKPRVEATSGRLSSIERDGSRIKVTYTTYDASGAEVGSKSLVVDRVVLATGYTDKLGTTLRGVVGQKGEYKSDLQDVVGQPEGFDAPVVVARQIANQNITLIGAAAGQLPSSAELRGVLENKAALFANTPRTQVAARVWKSSAKAGDAIRITSGRKGEQATSSTPNFATPLATENAAPASPTEPQESRLTVGKNKVVALDIERPAVVTKYGIVKAALGMSFAPGSTVRLFLSKEGEDLVVRAGAPSPLVSSVKAALEADSDFLRAARVMVESGKKAQTLSFRVNSKGELTFG